MIMKGMSSFGFFGLWMIWSLLTLTDYGAAASVAKNVRLSSTITTDF
jgi:hypothetical protein